MEVPAKARYQLMKESTAPIIAPAFFTFTLLTIYPEDNKVNANAKRKKNAKIGTVDFNVRIVRTQIKIAHPKRKKPTAFENIFGSV